MQTIISLIRLQNDGIDDITINNLLTTIQNRISAMSYLHELLYQKKIQLLLLMQMNILKELYLK
ncbi:MAG: histidine kinase dimerization/phosphoacceptor domain -containing protein [Aliarcobacter sp.]|nr:histidine kinase dimerization/phosphoacceptor domain -containing protein [Aliarcobacter sp.]